MRSLKHYNLILENYSFGLELYHYALSEYSVLKTSALISPPNKAMIFEGRKDVELRKMPGPYYDHISFFFERPPLDKMSSVFGNDHPFWYPGNKVYEHVVKIDLLPKIKYLITESPAINDFFYSKESDKLTDEEFYNEVYRIRVTNLEIGDSVIDLKKVIERLKGETLKNYLRLRTRPNFADIRKKYAATVPHVMLYPERGTVSVSKVNSVTIG